MSSRAPRDDAAVGLGHLAGDEQAKAGPFRLLRDKRLEELAADRLGRAGTGVRKRPAAARSASLCKRTTTFGGGPPGRFAASIALRIRLTRT